MNSPNVRIKNPSHVEKVFSNIINSGKDRLQVVSDFDRTISLHHYNGKPCPTSNAVLEMSRFVGPEFRKKVIYTILSLQKINIYVEFDFFLSFKS